MDAERKDFIMSEKKAQQGAAMRNIKLDSVMRAAVTRVEDYGVFVDLVDLPGVSGLVRAAPLYIGDIHAEYQMLSFHRMNAVEFICVAVFILHPSCPEIVIFN